LVGKINKEGLLSENYGKWFLQNYDTYQIDSVSINQFKDELKKYTITAFMGTWCGDSKREVPHFYKVLEVAEFPMERLTMVAVSREREQYKQSPGGEHEGLTIHRVPTFIFYKEGKEVNRIVESPMASLEKDIAAILSGNYTSRYHVVTLVSKLLQTNSPEEFEKKARKLISKLQKETTTMYELNTYAKVLFFAEKRAEAITVARLNTQLFPEEPKAYTALADKLHENGNPSEALKNYEKALSLDPENESLKKSVETLREKLGR
jgi:thiol-disulfide isomerase/thioredoxin